MPTISTILSAADKGFCRRLFQAEKLDFPKEADVNAVYAVNDAIWEKAFQDLDRLDSSDRIGMRTSRNMCLAKMGTELLRRPLGAD